jgi:hypothetical protein
VNPLAALLRSAKRRVYKNARRHARRWLAQYEPRLEECWREFKRISGQDFPFHPERARLIIQELERSRPRRILELGSGTSTAWFASHARRHGATLVSVDQHQGWLDAAMQSASLVGPVEGICAPVQIEPGLGGRYATELPDADFVYIDGPMLTLDLPGGQGVNLDVPDMLRRGRRPAVIVVDSRTDTVDYLRDEGLVRDYEFEPEFKYCLAKGDWLGALRFRRQSVFRRRGAAGA